MGDVRATAAIPPFASAAARTVLAMRPMPSPPFPDPNSQILSLIITNAINAMNSGETDARGAILHAAVHAWYEGHIQGEDACPGCDFRGELRKQQTRGWVDPDMN